MDGIKWDNFKGDVMRRSRYDLWVRGKMDTGFWRGT
jgi:hypothetical protein